MDDSKSKKYKFKVMSEQPRTIEDYKDVVKILKLKIIKQNKKIQDLENKNKLFEEQINGITIGAEDWNLMGNSSANELDKERTEADMNALRGKVAVMQAFLSGIKRVRITSQAVFRIADCGYKNCVEADYFRSVVSKIRLGLTPKELSCLVFIFDENCSGFITREEYHSCLHAYRVGVEEDCLPYIQQCLLKLSHLIMKDKVNVLKFYEEMEAKAKKSHDKAAIDLNVFEEQVKKHYAGRLHEREIVGSFHAIDLESQGRIEKNNFLYCITSYINKFLASQDTLTKKSNADWTSPGAKSQIIEDRSSHRKTGEESRNDRPPFPQTPAQSAIAKLQENYKVKLSSVYEQIIHTPLKNRISLNNFRKSVQKLSVSVPSELISSLYRQIDLEQKGSIHLKELLHYALSTRQQCDTIYRLLGKYFQLNDLDAEKYWFMFGLEPDMDISKNKFIQVMQKSFPASTGPLWEGVWQQFDRGRGSVNVGAIIKIWQKYQMD